MKFYSSVYPASDVNTEIDTMKKVVIKVFILAPYHLLAALKVFLDD